jgi:hypothetical protein
VGGTTAITTEPLLGPEQWLELGAMEIKDLDFTKIDIGVKEIELLLPEQKKRIISDAMLGKHYSSIYKGLTTGKNSDSNYEIIDDLLCWKGWLHALEKNWE